MGNFEQVYVTFIRTTPEKLWEAITNPEFTKQYWAGGENHSDWKPGSDWKHIGAGEQRPVRIAGKVLESNPPKRLVISWADPRDMNDLSRVTFELEPVGDTVRLNVIHGELAQGSTMATNINWGWPRVIASLKTFLETGSVLNVYVNPTCK